MKIAILGANGNVGKVLVEEAVSRGYEVLAVVRDKRKANFKEGVDVLEADAFDKDSLIQAFKGIAVVVSAYGPKGGAESDLIEATRNLIDAAKQAQVERFLMVGGAGGLLVSEGVTLANAGVLPKEWMPIVNAHIDAFKLFENEKDLNWTVLRPAALFESGDRTGQFRVGKDYLLSDSEGNSRISYQDYAIALFDELKNSEFNKDAFTVGY